LHKLDDGGYELLTKEAFIDSLERVRVTQQETNSKGRLEEKQKYVSRLWLKHPEGRQYRGWVFNPSHTPEGYYNTFRGFAVSPKKGSCELFKRHLLEVICSNNEDHYRYLWAWLADLIQNHDRRNKSGVAVALSSDKKGVGKGAFTEYLQAMIGEHHSVEVLNGENVTGGFNATLAEKVLCIMNEAVWAKGGKAGEILKGLITSPTIQLVRKGYDPITIDNYLRFIITSNQKHFVPVETDERRYFVLSVSDKRQKDRAYFQAIKQELAAGGASALLAELLEFDLAGVELRDVPQTEALLEQKLQGASSLDRWWLHELETGELWDSDPPGRVLCSELYNRYSEFAKGSGARDLIDRRALGVELRALVGSEILTPPTRIRHSGVHRFYQFPALDSCRAAHDKRYQTRSTWPVVESSQFLN
jgi:hypothetical protein